MKTIVKTQFEKDFETAQQTFNAYADLKKEKASIDASMKEAKAELEKFGKKHRNKFDEKNNLQMDGGYLHFGKEGKIILEEKTFKWSTFIKKFPKLVKLEIKANLLKNILLDADKSKEVRALGVDMTMGDKFDVKIKGEKEEE